MSRINTNVTSLISQRILGNQNNALNESLKRLSTGFRINTGKDDPAGLIASETMRAEMRAVQAAQTNVSRAMNVVSVAESGLSEINRMLNDLEDLVDRSANESGISDEERDANQQEIDLILQSINRIANSTELQGRKLLSGDLSYTTQNVDTADIANLQLNSVRVPQGGNRTVAIDATDAASQAIITYDGGAISAASSITVEIAGNLGTERFTFSNAALTDMSTAINQATQNTGVEALVSGTDLIIQSSNYGSEEFVRIRVLDTGKTFSTDATEDFGNDVTATVNGQSVTGSGLDLSVRTTTLDAEITLAEAFGSVTSGGISSFEVTGGGAQFAIAPKLDLNGLASLGISSLTTGSLGNANAGYLYEIGSGEAYALDQSQAFGAQSIVREALNQVATLRGRLGSFHKNTLETASSALAVQHENIAAAESILRDTDFAVETSNLTRNQILVQSATNVLRLANAQPQQVLALIG